MEPHQTLSKLTAKILTGLENYIENEKPDLILAHGDTTTCFATAISSFYHKIPFFHVEAGLRTHQLNTPFPEEFNRQTMAPVATHHFAPTDVEKHNLLKDGISPSSITVTGSTVHDAIRIIRSKKINNFPVQERQGPIVVVTLHRRETNKQLELMLDELRKIANYRTDITFVCPVHPSPRVKESFYRKLKGLDNVILMKPLEYPQFISLLLKSHLVITDSGGVQEECAFLEKKV